MIKRTAKGTKSLIGFLISLVNAFNPFAYRTITQKSLRQLANRLFVLLSIVTIATVALMVPALSSSSTIDKFSKLAIRMDVSTKAPIDARIFPLGNARVFINTTADAKTALQYDIVLTGSELRTRPLLCFFQGDICSLLGVRQHATSTKSIDLAQNNGRTILGIFLLFLPGMLIVLYTLMLVKYAAIITAVSLLSFVLLKVTRKGTGLLDSLKIATYAAVVLVVLDFAASLMRNGPIPIHQAVPVLAYLAMLITGLIINEQMGG